MAEPKGPSEEELRAVTLFAQGTMVLAAGAAYFEVHGVWPQLRPTVVGGSGAVVFDRPTEKVGSRMPDEFRKLLAEQFRGACPIPPEQVAVLIGPGGELGFVNRDGTSPSPVVERPRGNPDAN